MKSFRRSRKGKDNVRQTNELSSSGLLDSEKGVKKSSYELSERNDKSDLLQIFFEGFKAHPDRLCNSGDIPNIAEYLNNRGINKDKLNEILGGLGDNFEEELRSINNYLKTYLKEDTDVAIGSSYFIDTSSLDRLNIGDYVETPREEDYISSSWQRSHSANGQERLEIRKGLAGFIRNLGNHEATLAINSMAQQDVADCALPLFNELFGNVVTKHITSTPDDIAAYNQHEREEDVGSVVEIALASPQNLREPQDPISKIMTEGDSERMEGSNRLRLTLRDNPNRNDLTDGTQKTEILISPESNEVTFRIARFSYDYFNNTQSKNNSKIEFSSFTKNDKTYFPSAFICHRGESNKSGHYVAYVKANDNRWYFYNDGAEPQEVSEDELLKEAGTKSYFVKYSSDQALLPPKQEHGTPNGANWCWLNSLMAFTFSYTTIGRFADRQQEQEGEVHDNILNQTEHLQPKPTKPDAQQKSQPSSQSQSQPESSSNLFSEDELNEYVKKMVSDGWNALAAKAFILYIINKSDKQFTVPNLVPAIKGGKYDTTPKNIYEQYVVPLSGNQFNQFPYTEIKGLMRDSLHNQGPFLIFKIGDQYYALRKDGVFRASVSGDKFDIIRRETDLANIKDLTIYKGGTTTINLDPKYYGRFFENESQKQDDISKTKGDELQSDQGEESQETEIEVLKKHIVEECKELEKKYKEKDNNEIIFEGNHCLMGHYKINKNNGEVSIIYDDGSCEKVDDNDIKEYKDVLSDLSRFIDFPHYYQTFDYFIEKLLGKNEYFGDGEEEVKVIIHVIYSIFIKNSPSKEHLDHFVEFLRDEGITKIDVGIIDSIDFVKFLKKDDEQEYNHLKAIFDYFASELQNQQDDISLSEESIESKSQDQSSYSSSKSDIELVGDGSEVSETSSQKQSGSASKPEDQWDNISVSEEQQDGLEMQPQPPKGKEADDVPEDLEERKKTSLFASTKEKMSEISKRTSEGLSENLPNLQKMKLRKPKIPDFPKVSFPKPSLPKLPKLSSVANRIPNLLPNQQGNDSSSESSSVSGGFGSSSVSILDSDTDSVTSNTTTSSSIDDENIKITHIESIKPSPNPSPAPKHGLPIAYVDIGKSKFGALQSARDQSTTSYTKMISEREILNSVNQIMENSFIILKKDGISKEDFTEFVNLVKAEKNSSVDLSKENFELISKTIKDEAKYRFANSNKIIDWHKGEGESSAIEIADLCKILPDNWEFKTQNRIRG